MHKISDAIIQVGPLNLVRVGPGKLGLAKINGRPIILDTGLHFINSAGSVILDPHKVG